MLTIKCSGCKSKLFKYKKIGSGEVLRCHKSRITKWFECLLQEAKISCPCGKVVGIDQGRFYKMNSSAFTYTGTKDNK